MFRNVPFGALKTLHLILKLETVVDRFGVNVMNKFSFHSGNILSNSGKHPNQQKPHSLQLGTKTFKDIYV